MSDKNSFLVFSGTNSRYLAEKICASLGCPLGNLVVTKFSDGELAFLLRNLSADATYSSYKAPSLIQTT